MLATMLHTEEELSMKSKSARPALRAAFALIALAAVALVPGGASAAGHGADPSE
jgi:hypothetical protein